MSCGYCDKLDGLPEIGHSTNGTQTYGMGGFKFSQLYKCPWCEEYLRSVQVGAAVGVEAGKTLSIERLGYDLSKIE